MGTRCRSIRQQIDTCLLKIEELEIRKASAVTRPERVSINQRIAALRDTEEWLRSRSVNF